MAKLWKKDYDVDTLIEEFTVGQDFILDKDLVVSDCLGSMAQAKMLQRIGIITEAEEMALHSALAGIIRDHEEGRFVIEKSDEDCHTAIENRLVRDLGEAGKKIHTGRSRNDQVLTALRLRSRDEILGILEDGAALSETLLESAETYKNIPMPGRTHTQLAMPSSVGLWMGSYAEEILDDLELVRAVYDLINRCPLGSAASYGTPLPLDREYVAELLGFPEVHNNTLAANNSRGKLESAVLDSLDGLGITLSKIAADLILFSLPEFGYFSLPKELCTGSSIMPQKKNPDGLELMRAKAAALGAYASGVKNIIRSLPSGYNRDFQETKEPFLRGLGTAGMMLRVTKLLILKLEVHPENLRKAFSPEIYATDAAYELVLAGATFRDAYKEVGLNLQNLETRNPEDSISNRTSTGTAGNLRLDLGVKRARRLQEFASKENRLINTTKRNLIGLPVK